MRPDEALKRIEEEYLRASDLYADLHSNHEGYAVIKEEMDELWDEIKKSKETKGNKQMQKELIQIGAMVVRFLDNLC
jgi:hypothetical protein